MKLHFQLSELEREQLRTQTRAREVTPEVRERAEVLLLADRGWTAVALAQHFGRHERTIRRWLKAYQQRGAAALAPAPRGPAPDLARRARVEAVLAQLLAQERTWTAPQLAAALAEHDIRLAPRSVQRYLQRLGARYKRVYHHVQHRQDELAVARAKTVLADRKKAR